jgi:hypothetical protein
MKRDHRFAGGKFGRPAAGRYEGADGRDKGKAGSIYLPAFGVARGR